MLKAVIFDMDGVLVDSEPIHFGMESIVFERLGIAVPLEERHSFVGMSGAGMWAYLKRKYSLENTVRDLLDYDNQFRMDYLAALPEIPSIPGVREVLHDLGHRGIKCALASSSSMAVIDIMMAKTGLGGFFDPVISGESVENGKPDPDLFLKAARLMEEAPSDCIVIEDSRNGVRAAVSAGMKCIGYANPASGSQDLSAADIIIDDMKKLDYGLLTSVQSQ